MRCRMPLLAGVALMVLTGCQPRPSAETEIAIAVRDNDAQALGAYLGAGGDPDARSRDGFPLIYIASGPRGGAAVLDALIAGGADVEAAAGNGRTALMNAAGWCDVQRVTILLRAGADPRRTTPGNQTARDAVCAGPLDLRAQVLAILDAAP